MNSAPHLLLVDCSAFAYRAFYSLPAMRREKDGEPTGAVLQFMKMIWNMLGAAQADKPTYGAAVFDAPGKNFRHDLFPNYKGMRPAARTAELRKQLPIMRPVAEVLGLTVVELPGFEADDLIATLALQARAMGIRSTIVSSDKDFGQLVEDGWIEIVDPMQKVRDPTKGARRLEADIKAKFGVPPRLVADVQALAGDAVDGIPGLPDCGLDTAAKLVRSFGSLEGVLENLDEIRIPKVRAVLRRQMDLRVDTAGKTKLIPAPAGSKKSKTGSEWARQFFKLTHLRRDVPLNADIRTMDLRPILKSDLEHVAKKLDPAANIQFLFGLDLQNTRVVDRMDDPLAWWREELRIPNQKLPATPACGFYKTKLVRGGPWVGARIWREKQIDPISREDMGYDLLRCEVGGKPRDPLASFPSLAMYPIRQSDFEFMTADAAHAVAYRPTDPKASPHKPIDITKQPAPINPRFKRTIS